MQAYIGIFIYFLVAFGLAGVILVLSRFLGPHKPNERKSSPYECGIVPFGDARKRFSIQFYVIAMLFILFDIEGVFLWPWAAALKQLLETDRALALGEMGAFLGILIVGFVYLFKRGSLEWE